MEWQPIETAPKDGTKIRIRRDMGGAWGWVYGTGHWESVSGAYGVVEGWISNGDNDPPGNLGLGHPDEWRYLSEPPA